jgi:ATP-dependent DNA helicase RecG
VYWVCTLIEESEDAKGAKIEAQAAQVTYEALSQALPELQVGLLHGRMKPARSRP